MTFRRGWMFASLLAAAAACSTGGNGGPGPVDDAGKDAVADGDPMADGGDGQSTPDTPVTPDAPKTPDVPVTPDAPTMDVAPMDVAEDTPAAPDAPKTPDVPVTPDVGPDAPPDVTCTAPQINCAGACVDPQTDTAHCGACGMACMAGQRCVMGACETPCAADQTRCGGACVNTQSDGANCGACGRACPMGQMCAMGACATTCMPGQSLCGAGMGMPGSCADLSNDSSNCGMCGRSCPMGQRCAMGMCACPMGQTSCDGACVDTQSSAAHCGACGRACPMGQSCAAGMCVCAMGQTSCGGACVNTQSDNANCGACGRACPAGQSCAMGACACAMGQTLCGTPGACVNLMTDNANCGACGRACAAGQTCTGATCTGGSTATNDNCATPTTINLAAGPSITVMGTTTGATNSANSCTANADVFYQFTLTRREVVYFDTFGTAWDTYLGIQRPGCAAAATACADDSCGTLQTQIVQTLEAGTYLLVVDQFNAGGGAFTLHVQHHPAASGTSSALDLSAGTRRLSGTTTGSGLVDTGCCSGGPENMYVATTCPSFTETSFAATTCSLASWDTDLAFFSGNRSAAGGVVCNDDSCGLQSNIAGTIPAGAGLHVLFLDGCGSGSGAYGIDLTIGGACPTGQTRCGTTCVNLQTDRANCGACARACAAGQLCAAGACRAPSTYTFAPGTATFVDACAAPGATVVLRSVDDVVNPAVNIGFTFPFYGTAHTQVRPTSNGYLLFGGTATPNDNAYYPSMMLPDASRPAPGLYVYNSDLLTRATGVCLATVGTAPNRRFVYEGADQAYCCSTQGNFTFEAILNEADSSIDYVYQRITFPAGDTHNNVVGLQNSGTVGVTYEYRAGGALTRVMTGTSLHITPAP